MSSATDPWAARERSRMDLGQQYFLAAHRDVQEDKRQAANKALLDAVRADSMGPFYERLCTEFGWKRDEKLAEELQKKNKAEQEELERKVDDAQENFGETEVRETLLAVAEFFVRIGDKDRAETAYRVTAEKTIAGGQKLDIALALIRVGFFFDDDDLVRRNIEKAKALCEEGGDWERRNRLKVYEALQQMKMREFFKAAELLLSVTATFSCFELLDFESYARYVVVLSMVSLDRLALKEKVVDNADLRTLMMDVPHMNEFLRALYDCTYESFMSEFAYVLDFVRFDRFLAAHYRHYYREMRIVVYSQFLAPYRSVTLTAMANAFRVTEEFMDRELSEFIALDRLSCKIDKVAGLIETTRPDSKNAHYQATIKKGDALLNRIQRLSAHCTR